MSLVLGTVVRDGRKLNAFLAPEDGVWPELSVVEPQAASPESTSPEGRTAAVHPRINREG